MNVQRKQNRSAARFFLMLAAAFLTSAGAARADEAAARPAAKPAASKPAATRPAKAGSEFVRFVDDKKGGGRLEVAVGRYEDRQGVRVDLVSALHVGEKSYYDGLTRRFKTYDALLYELVKPKDSDVPRPGAARAGGGGGGAIGGFQRVLKNVLELEFQLDAIDYTPRNFVHADLDYETFARMQEERGESLFTLMIRSMLAEATRQDAGKGSRPITLIDLLAAMNSPDSARQYKLLLARQFQDVEAQLAGLEGEEGTVILAERNKAALKVLRESIAGGKKKIGIFYGAGHMPGIAKPMVQEMGFRKVGEEWLVAWDMTAGAAPATNPATRVRPPKQAPAEVERSRPASEPQGANR